MSREEELRAELEKLKAELEALKSKDESGATNKIEGSGAMAQGKVAVASGNGGVSAGGNIHGSVIHAEKGATVVVGEAAIPMSAVDRKSALGRYLQYITSRNCYLQLQGIRSGGKLVNIELDRIYIRLRTTQQRLAEEEEHWLATEADQAPGEMHRLRGEQRAPSETVIISVEDALKEHTRLVVLGDPGSGKTTLLRYLTLPYAKDLADKTTQVREKLNTNEPGRLPIFLPLREIGIFLKSAPQDGTEGHAQLLEYLQRSLAKERIELPVDFFDEWLDSGKAVVLLDGMDEVADPDLRRRVARLVEAFVRAYPDCRYVVTSRIVGYSGPARLGESFATTIVRDFTLSDVKQFLTNWHRLVAIGQMGGGEAAELFAADQTRQLMLAIQENERIRELAINPLMLTVIALVHRDRVKLPDRRAELYAEAVDVLLGKWDEARGVEEIKILPGRTFDAGDRRLMLQQIALYMHQKELKEIWVEDLNKLLQKQFLDNLGESEQRAAEQAAEHFIAVIRERTGLLVARGEGVYAFSHLTFQEYLAALALAAQDAYREDTLQYVSKPWWHEVILLEAGYLSTQSQQRTTRLIKAIADQRSTADVYGNLVLAAECLRDVGSGRVTGGLQQEVMERLRKGVEAPPPFISRFIKSMGTRGWIEQRSRAMEALVRAGGGFWSKPFGEPEWVNIPAGEFWMGSDLRDFIEMSLQKLSLPDYRIARVPVTNAQYFLFIQDSGHDVPLHWEEERPPKGLEGHPVVYVSFDDAKAYCEWLSRMTGKAITLPSEAEWEKAARGSSDKREYPWGDRIEATRCNNGELLIGNTTPVGIFPDGASPFGCLDMSGNVWEWTRSRYLDQLEAYPTDKEKRQQLEDMSGNDRRVLRGGSFDVNPRDVRCASRRYSGPDFRSYFIGFRVVVSPSPSLNDEASEL
ncbi:MAG: SUMF1/EgtB/PvdO family nonheme iron enzyme [Pseudomonadota bacterium]